MSLCCDINAVTLWSDNIGVLSNIMMSAIIVYVIILSDITLSGIMLSDTLLKVLKL